MQKILPAIFLLIHLGFACVPAPDFLTVYPNESDAPVLRLPLNDYPLSSYLRSNFCKHPFKMSSTANLRGYTAYWSLKKSRLYLDSVFVESPGMLRGVHLDWIFGKPVAGSVSADWVNGVLLAGHHDFFDSKRDTLIQFAYKFKNGRLVDSAKYHGPTVNAQKPKKYVDLAELDKQKGKMQTGRNELCPEIQIQENVQENLNLARNSASALRQKKYKTDFAKIESIVKKDSAYESFLKDFSLRKSYFVQNNSILFLLKPLKKSFVSEVKLQFLLDGNRIGFEKIHQNFHKSLQTLEKFKWLKNWVKQSLKHSAILKMGNSESGLSIESLVDGINNVWESVNLPGKAETLIELSNDGEKVAGIFFGSDSDVAVVTALYPSKMGHKNNLLSFSEDMDIYCSALWGDFEFATVSTDGAVQMQHKYNAKLPFLR